jgi:MYXO-CTERM domain-containing protein
MAAPPRAGARAAANLAARRRGGGAGGGIRQRRRADRALARVALRLQNRARMKRLLIALAVSVPIAVVASIQTAPSGKVVDLDNYNAKAAAPTSYINKAHCDASKQLNLQWSIVRSGNLTASAVYKLYASNTAPATTGDNANYCPEAPITGGGTADVWADPLGSQVGWTADIQGAGFSGKDAAAIAHVDCTRDGGVVYICSHLYDGTRKGYASGRFEIQVTAPAAPSISDVGAASETSLFVSWSAPTSGVQVDHYRVVATSNGVEVGSATTSGPTTSATIDNLAEGTSYSVVVYAYSLGGNESPPSAAMGGTPGPVYDFWETYKNAGGRDDGGCASGAAGPLALLGVAALLRLRRRK